MRLCLFVAAAALATASLAAHADTLYATSFEAPTFQTGALAGQNGFTGSVGQVESGFAYSGSQAVVFATSGNTGSQSSDEVALSFTPAGGFNTIILQVEALFTSASNSSNFDVLAANTNSGFADQLQYQNGIVTVGGGNSNVGAVPVAANTWNAYSLAFNFDTQTATGYVNGIYIGSELFASPATSFSTASFGINFQTTSATDSAYFDNVSVSTAAITPEPSSLALLGTGLLGMVGVARKRFTR